jgi:hypothetical protein
MATVSIDDGTLIVEVENPRETVELVERAVRKRP